MTIEYTGDTLIEGTEYKIVGDHYLLQQGDSVSFWWEGSNRLIYDFGAEVGDTITFEFFGFAGDFGAQEYGVYEYRYLVTQSDVINIDGQDLRHVICESLSCDAQSYEYIEKVGSTLRMIENCFCCSTFPEIDPDWLRCYSDHEIEFRTDKFLSYGGDTLACDYTPPPNSVIEINAVRLVVSPNPATDVIQLSSSGELSGPGRVELHNLAGQLVWEQDLILGPQTQLKIGDLTPGIYQLVVRAEDGSYGLGKIVKR